MKRYTKQTALKFLLCNTHLFLTPQDADALAKPFGIKANIRVEKATAHLHPKGLSFDDCRSEGEGIASWDLAAQICRHVGAQAEGCLGRGSQQRAYVKAAAEQLKIEV